MTVRTFKSGGRLEEIGGYARAKRVGPFVFIAGTSAIEPSGKLYAPDDVYAQSLFILHRIADDLAAVGAGIQHVVRTRAFLADIASGATSFLRAHGEVFRGIDPVTSGVGAGLTQPGMVVEIEAEAVVTDDQGRIRFDCSSAEGSIAEIVGLPDMSTRPKTRLQAGRQRSRLISNRPLSGTG